MQQVELTKSQFLALAERMANEALRKHLEKVELSAFGYSMCLVDYELEIEYILKADKDELWDFALKVLALSDYIVMR